MFDFLSEQFSSIFSRLTGSSTLTEKNVEDALFKVRDALLEGDVPYNVVEAFIDEVKKDIIGQKVVHSVKPADLFVSVVYERLKAFLGGSAVAFTLKTPSVVMLMGLQGSGKTTTIAKFVHFLCAQGNQGIAKDTILLASVDFYRPAAIDQLELLANKVGVSLYRSPEKDPVAAAYDIAKQYSSRGYKLLVLDTAGRLHVDQAMLDELVKIEKAVAPKHKLLVLDAMTGQESLAIAQAFEQAVGFDAAIMTKVDSGTRAGAAFAFAYVMKKSIIFVGTGEKVGDLERFYPDRMAKRILGMGDIDSLVEKVDAAVAKEEQERAYTRMMSGSMTLEDFAAQLTMMSKLGSLSGLMDYLPGMKGAKISPEAAAAADAEMRKSKAIINSMTPKERRNHTLLDSSRKKRIAQGAGVVVADVNRLLQQFEQSLQFVKLFKKSGFRNFF